MHYLYILFSLHANKYYVGESEKPWSRLQKHQDNYSKTFTGKYDDWQLKALFKVDSRSTARKIEVFIKKQKSRKLIERLCDSNFIPNGQLSQLVRVPHLRD